MSDQRSSNKTARALTIKNSSCREKTKTSSQSSRLASRRYRGCINLIKEGRLLTRSKSTIILYRRSRNTFSSSRISPEWWASQISRGKVRGVAKGSFPTLFSRWNKTWKISNKTMTNWTEWSKTSSWVKIVLLSKEKCFRMMKILGYKTFWGRLSNVSTKLSKKIGS